jgi:hypothetical protein
VVDGEWCVVSGGTGGGARVSRLAPPHRRSGDGGRVLDATPCFPTDCGPPRPPPIWRWRCRVGHNPTFSNRLRTATSTARSTANLAVAVAVARRRHGGGGRGRWSCRRPPGGNCGTGRPKLPLQRSAPGWWCDKVPGRPGSGRRSAQRPGTRDRTACQAGS